MKVVTLFQAQLLAALPCVPVRIGITNSVPLRVKNLILGINCQFFHPLPQMPRTNRDKDYFIKTIDTFAAIGGDMFIFKPLQLPDWHRLPDCQ